jgi:hypothetical protein
MAIPQNGWHDFKNGDVPSEDGVYLVLLGPSDIDKTGGNPPIVTARFIARDRRWDKNGCIGVIPEFEKFVKFWHELPSTDGIR